MNVRSLNVRRIHYFIFIFLSFILLFPCYAVTERGVSVKPISPLGTEVKGNQWLFVIGINTYIYWPHLKTAVNDAKALKNVLLSRYYFDEDHLIELYDDQATEKNILAKLRYLANKVGKDDSLVIFYAGHGHLDSITKEGSWIPVESDVTDASAWITNYEIKNYLKIDAIKAKHILLISDSCFAGDFFRGLRGKLPEITDKIIIKAYELSSREAITSGGLEPVSDAGLGNNSVFSHFLVNALNENQREFLVPSDIFPYIKAGVVENSEQLPEFGSLKDTGGQQGGELVFFLKQESRLKDLSAESLERKRELESLKEMEIANEAAKKKETEEIAKRKIEIDTLDAKIEEMKKRLGTASTYNDDSLDTMYAMVQQKEQQQKLIDDLKRQREAEAAKRRAEIERLTAKNREKRIAEIKEDIHKYERIISSQFGKDMKEEAWKKLTNKYPETRGLKVGDIFKFSIKTGLIKEIDRDERFVAYENRTVLDTKTGLVWASTDNGKDINWEDAKRYCDNYRGGGYTDWRMPTPEELEEIFDGGKWKKGYLVTKLIDITWRSVWSSEKKDEFVTFFDFHSGFRDVAIPVVPKRALPVRGGN
jgi:hypothetical protein